MDFQINKKQRSRQVVWIALAVLFLDQALKFAALNNFAGLQFNKNYTSLLGLNSNLYLALLLFLAIFIYLKKDAIAKSGNSATFGCVLLFTGIISNSADMFFYGYIIDYIAIPNFFSFNISDLSIGLGALILGWKILEK